MTKLNYKTLHDLPIVIDTNSFRTEDIIDSYNNGVNIFVTKPFSYRKEIILIRKIISFYSRLILPPRESLE